MSYIGEANARFWRLHMPDVHSFRITKMDQLRLCLANQVIKRRDPNNRIKLKAVTKLADLTGRKWRLPLDIKFLILQKAT